MDFSTSLLRPWQIGSLWKLLWTDDLPLILKNRWGLQPGANKLLTDLAMKHWELVVDLWQCRINLLLLFFIVRLQLTKALVCWSNVSKHHFVNTWIHPVFFSFQILAQVNSLLAHRPRASICWQTEHKWCSSSSREEEVDDTTVPDIYSTVFLSHFDVVSFQECKAPFFWRIGAEV